MNAGPSVKLIFHRDKQKPPENSAFFPTRRISLLPVPGKSAPLWPMHSLLVMTVIGPDRTGLVRNLAATIAQHGGNWLESRMARMAGQFAGIVKVDIAEENIDSLLASLDSTENGELQIHAVREAENVGTAPANNLRIEVFASDRPGIIRELSEAIAHAGGNVEDLSTGIESAPMSGEPMFRAKLEVSCPEGTDASALVTAIESLGSDFTADISQPR